MIWNANVLLRWGGDMECQCVVVIWNGPVFIINSS